jgi:hypothetical protein
MNYERVTLARAREVLNSMDYLASVNRKYSIRCDSTMEGMINWYWVEYNKKPILPIVHISSCGSSMLINDISFLEN